jgi:phage gp46-like protein
VSDIATVFDPANWRFDWRMSGPDLASDPGIGTAVIISLFTDQRAEDDDVLPDDAVGPFGISKKGSGDRRGWFGDFLTAAAADVLPGQPYPTPRYRIGSRLWLYRRRKMTDDLPGLIQQDAARALQWLVDDGIATEIQTSAVATDRQTITLSGTITLPDGSAYDFAYPLSLAPAPVSFPRIGDPR